MVRVDYKNYFAIILSFIFAMMLTVFYIPKSIEWIRPNFVVLTLIFWVLLKPNVVEIYFAFFLGIFLDLLLNNPLGASSLALCVITYLTNYFRTKLNSFCVWQKALTILLLVGLYQLLLIWIHLLVDKKVISFSYWVPIFISVLLWPLIYFLLSKYKLLFKII